MSEHDWFTTSFGLTFCAACAWPREEAPETCDRALLAKEAGA